MAAGGIGGMISSRTEELRLVGNGGFEEGQGIEKDGRTCRVGYSKPKLRWFMFSVVEARRDGAGCMWPHATVGI
jgi:hypothetical protein